VRLAGCWLIVYGVRFGMYAVSIAATPTVMHATSPLEYAMGMLAYCAGGAALIWFAPNVVRLCYANSDGD
jgi:hypothetical protein